MGTGWILLLSKYEHVHNIRIFILESVFTEGPFESKQSY
jgi:hypothetical protein